MANIPALLAANTARWKKAKLTRTAEFVPVAKRLVAAKSRYQAVSAKTGVPWFVIAVIHQRESSQNFSRSLAQGDPWNEVSTHVPKGRGPFSSWEAAAVDALAVCPPYASKWKDWSAGGTMTLLEQYNGLGYANKGIPSPYVWSGTDQYVQGKYISDGVFSATTVDKQLGCAGLIVAMAALDPSISFGGVVAPVPDAPLPKPKPPVTKSDKAVVGGAVVVAGSATAQYGLWIGLGVVALLGLSAFLYFKFVRK
mgnify:FL=1